MKNKLNAEEFDSKYDEYSQNNQKEKTESYDNKPNMLSIHGQLSELDLNITQMVFDATSLHSSALWDKSNVHPKIKTGNSFKPDMNDIVVNDFNKKTFEKDGKDSAVFFVKILKMVVE